jgi:DNA-binding MarR family transcriptional regulator
MKKAARKEDNGSWLDRSPAHLLHRVGQCAEDIFHAHTKGIDLTPRQFAVLDAVQAAEGLSQTGLVERTGIDRSTLADIVRRLQRKGLLERRRSNSDKRAYEVKLTHEGRRILQKVQPLAKKVDDLIFASLPGKDGETFLSSLQSFIAKLRADIDPATMP